MKKEKTTLRLALIVLTAAFPCFMNLEAAGETGMQFLRMAPDARGNALAGAMTGEAVGLTGLYWNPGGLAGGRDTGIMLSYNSLIADMNYIYAAAGFPLMTGTLAASAVFLGEGTPEISQGAIEIPASSYDLCISAGYGLKLGPVMAGAALRIVTSSIFGDKTTGGVVDVGANLKIGKSLYTGLVFRNLGFASSAILKPDNMPMLMQAGLSWRYLKGSQGLRLMASADVDLQSDEPVYVNVGAEYGFRKALFLRAGYRINTGGNVLGGLKGLTLGLGGTLSVMKGLSADVAWIPMSDLGNSYQVTLSLKI